MSPRYVYMVGEHELAIVKIVILIESKDAIWNFIAASHLVTTNRLAWVREVDIFLVPFVLAKENNGFSSRVRLRITSSLLMFIYSTRY